MYQRPHKQVHAAELVVAFTDGAAHSRIPSGANVADICETVGVFSRRRQQTPLFVKVQFDVLSPNDYSSVSLMPRRVQNAALAQRTPEAELVKPALDQSSLSALRRHAKTVASHDPVPLKAIMN